MQDAGYPVCSVDGCEVKVIARGWCNKHYERWRTHGDAEFSVRQWTRTPGLDCSVNGCGKPKSSGGLCAMHYARLRTHGSVGTPHATPRKKKGVPCEVDGCVRPADGDGLCRMHYERRRKGKPLGGPEPLRRAAGEGSVAPSGYITISVNGRQVLEHRYVVEQALGRLLRSEESVHHLNGNRSDNRLVNLELWTTAHPYGQRVTDVIAFVVENYPDAVRAALDGKPQQLWLH